MRCLVSDNCAILPRLWREFPFSTVSFRFSLGGGSFQGVVGGCGLEPQTFGFGQNGEEFSPLRRVCLAVSGVPPEPGGFIHPRTPLTKVAVPGSAALPTSA